MVGGEALLWPGRGKAVEIVSYRRVALEIDTAELEGNLRWELFVCFNGRVLNMYKGWWQVSSWEEEIKYTREK